MMGLFMEDIELNRRVALGAYEFTRENMLAYARKFDPVEFHVDEDAGRASAYGAMTAAGLHTASGWMSCFVAASAKARQDLEQQGKVLPELGPSPGFQNMRWLKPIFAGEVISFFTTPIAKRLLRSRAGWGMVSGYNEGINQAGDLVFSFESAVMVESAI